MGEQHLCSQCGATSDHHGSGVLRYWPLGTNKLTRNALRFCDWSCWVRYGEARAAEQLVKA